MTRRHLRWPRGVATVLLVGAVSLAGCARPATDAPAAAPTRGPTDTPSPTATPGAAASSAVGASAQGVPAAPLGECASGQASTRTPGILTLATGADRSAPWFVGEPAGGQGLEAAVALAVAQGLGFDATQTRWVQVDRNAALAGRTDTFDLDLDGFSAAELNGLPVDASSGYFADADAVLVPAASAPESTLAALASRRLVELPSPDGSTAAVRDDGAVVTGGTVGDPAAAVDALTSGSAGGAVLPLTDALAAAGADPAVTVLGRLRPPSGSQPDQLVALLASGSALTPCVSAVLDRMRVEGTLAQLAQTWVPVPVLE